MLKHFSFSTQFCFRMTQRQFDCTILRFYHLVNDKRVYVSQSEYDRSPNKFIAMKYQFSLNTNLHESYWQRHELSWPDIEQTIKAADSYNLARLCLKEGFDNNQSVKPCYSEPNNMKVVGRTQSLKKILEHLKARLKHLPADEKLANNDTHVPSLAIHTATPQEMKEICATVGESTSDVSNLIVPGNFIYHKTMQWKDVQIIPYDVKHIDHVLHVQMMTVVPKHVYLALYGAPRTLRDAPFDYRIGQECEMFCDTPESFYFCCQSIEQRTGSDLLAEKQTTRTRKRGNSSR